MSNSIQEHPIVSSPLIPTDENIGINNGSKIHLEAEQLQLCSGASTRSSCLEDTRIKPRKKAAVKYMDCLKNHAAAIGGHATDGCGEYMPAGAEGSIEALKCSACNCHRNFHRKVVQADNACSSQCHHMMHYSLLNAERRVKLSLENPKTEQNHEKVLSKKIELQESSEADHDEPIGMGRKRCRTRFTQEQKEKMLSFSEKVGWKMQKLDANLVHHFCQEIGIKRSVLKVWMHNNKHNLANKSFSAS